MWVADGPISYFVLLPLPIGISFFVFHNISAIVDFFKLGKARSMPSLSELTLYILFFPQLVSGPITKAARFFPQIAPKSIRDIPYVQIVKLLILGYFMKLYVANNLNEFTAYMAPEVMDRVAGGDRLLLVFLYSYQIYADFFGYSTIALALGLLFGYRLPINFNLPYIAASFSEFWTRWHISLSSWLRDYLYIPLGGNRRGQLRTNLNLMIVMGLGGLWHGASANYLLWGLLHGVYLVVERAMGLRRAETRPIVLGLRIGVVFVIVSLSWLLFRFADFGDMVRFASGIARDFRFAYAHEVYLSAVLCVTPVILQHLFVGGCPPKIAPFVYGGMLALVMVASGPDTTFIYFRF
jgi:D-alanyl-lipoteichoic acid acyltransferase DltB (MBOAT superfamily)